VVRGMTAARSFFLVSWGMPSSMAVSVRRISAGLARMRSSTPSTWPPLSHACQSCRNRS
jgi:hypothetical protein